VGVTTLLVLSIALFIDLTNWWSDDKYGQRMSVFRVGWIVKALFIFHVFHVFRTN
jgi:hypothetical protein